MIDGWDKTIPGRYGYTALSYLQSNYTINPETNCWVWKSAAKSGRYGKCRFRGKIYIASRFSWLLHNGNFDLSLDVCHRCDNPPCVNPGHLFLGTSLENVHDAKKKGRLRVPFGEAHARSKLSAALVFEIRRSSEPVSAMARRLGFSVSTVWGVKKGLSWRHIETTSVPAKDGRTVHGLTTRGKKKTRRSCGPFTTADEAFDACAADARKVAA